MLAVELLLYLAVISLVVGVFIFEKNPRAKQNLSFALIMLGSSLWSFGIFLLHVLHNFYWPDKLTHFGGLILAFGFYCFSFVFPNALRPVSWKRLFIRTWPLGLILAVLPFNLIIKGVNYENGRLSPINGPLFPLLVLVYLGYAIFVFMNIAQQYRRNTGVNRERILYVLLGISLFALFAVAFDVVLPEFGITYLKLLGPYASLFFIILSSIGIVSYRLMDVRLLAKSILINMLSLIAVISVSVLLYGSRFKNLSVDHWLFALSFFIPIILFFGCRYILNLITTRLFLKKYYRSRDIFNELNIKLNHEFEPTNIISLTQAYLKNALELEWIKFNRSDVGDDPEIVDFVHGLEQPFYIRSPDEGQIFGSYPDNPIAIIPLKTEDEFIGYFVLGPQEGVVGLGAEQMHKIDSTAAHIETAYARALLYRNLENKVEAQVQDLTFKNRQLNKVMKSRIDFLQMISHQLRSPVTSLKGSLELLMNKGMPTVHRRELLKIAHDKARDLADSFESILDLAKVEKGMGRAGIQAAINLNEIFSNILKVLIPQAEAKELNLIYEPSKTPNVIGNKIYLEQAFFNLIENAILNTEDGEIKVNFQEEEDYIIVMVSDTGPGIPPAIKERIFKKHTKGSGSKGSGMGLYIVQSIIRTHPKAHIWFETSPFGTTFYVRLLRAKS